MEERYHSCDDQAFYFTIRQLYSALSDGPVLAMKLLKSVPRNFGSNRDLI
ncbi:hypothetical protein WH47_10522 [Habropoda laboriosa]|uniref:Uncharacterized protein n=1 Tax=Habropoda laboriosa TaxID=597456 RepID=A0A0L7QMT6_9HYME|nr:hypothetical protein WH47_10522 [Habropoda laboriosa]